MILTKEVNFLGLVKRVRQIANELDDLYDEDYDSMSLDTLAFRLKIVAAEYNCFINSWAGMNCDGRTSGVECYFAPEYDEENDATWELILGVDEPTGIITAFKWLADRGYFSVKISEIRKLNEENDE